MMHKRDLRKQIRGIDAASKFAARYFPRAWPDGPVSVEEFILDCARRLMKSKSYSISIGSLFVHKIDPDDPDSSYEVWVNPSKWSE